MDRFGEGETMDRAGLRGRRGERGQSAFEFAIVLPFIFLIIYVMVEGVLFLQQLTVLDHAVREGARSAAMGHTSAQILACVNARGGGGNLTSGQVSVLYGPATGTPVAGATATVQGPVQVKIAGYNYNVTSSFGSLNYSIPISPQTTMRVEAAATGTPAAPCQ